MNNLFIHIENLTDHTYWIVPLTMNFDRVLSQLGEFGPWQRRNTLLLWLPSAGAGINVLIAAFAVMGPRNGFRCRNACDGEQFSFEFPGHSSAEMFPSLDPSSPHYSPDSPDYCQFYRAQPQDGSCTFNTSSPLAHCRRDDDFAFAPFQMSDQPAATPSPGSLPQLADRE